MNTHGLSPRVTVVVPNYNYVRTLALCLDSVLDQTYSNIDILVVDDGSTDGSYELALRFAGLYDNCRVVRTLNKGVSAARNYGVRQASGDLIFFVDSDIALHPDVVERAVATLAETPDVGAVCGIYDSEPLIDDGPVERYKTIHGHYWRSRNSGDVQAMFFSIALVRKRVFEVVGPLDESLRATEDVEYGARMAPDFRILLSRELIGRHDDEHSLATATRKQFSRSVPLVSLFLRKSAGRPKHSDTAYRASSIAIVGTMLAFTVSAVLVPPAVAAAVVCFLLFVLNERLLLINAVRSAGIAFLPCFAALHLYLNIVTGLAALIGGAKWLVSKRYRNLYDGGEKALDAVPS